jgi:Flp pilus assembly pilin Flp
MSRSLVRRNRGVSSVEYIVVLVLVAIAGILIFKTFGTTLKNKMSTANSKMESDVNP